MDAHDHDLLTRFRANRDEAAFRLLVDRHIGMVYSVARRVTDNTALAEEVAQATFTKLADKSAGITRETALAGWLYQTSRRLALSAVRSDARRRQREQIAAAMNLNEPSPSVVAEYLEPAMDQLAPDDRDALLLRFFENRTLRDVGQELGLSEDAARMRVNRAIERMRDAFAKLGITGTAAWLGTTLTTSATASVPAGLGATITTAVLGGTAVAAVATAIASQTTATTMNLFNLKIAAAILGAVAVTGTTTYLVQEREAHQLRADYQTLNAAHGKLAAEQQDARELIQLRNEQIAALKRDVGDLPRLRGEVDRLNRELSSIQNENDSLKRRLTHSMGTPTQGHDGVEGSNPANAASISKADYAFSGHNSPQAAWQSMLWSIAQNNVEVCRNSMTENARSHVPGLENVSSGFIPDQLKKGFLGQPAGYQILEVLPLPFGESLIKVRMEGTGEWIYEVVFQRTGEERTGETWAYDRLHNIVR
jgi:RNA polymerase sigma factor (sigma-70 family)